MIQFGKYAPVEYSNNTPKPTLQASLNIDKYKLKIIEPLGNIPKDTILFADDAITWNVKNYPSQGALYEDLGNDTLYPKKYVNVIAMTNVRCDVNPQSIVLLKNKNAKA